MQLNMALERRFTTQYTKAQLAAEGKIKKDRSIPR
jgi:hypothetical protein